MHYAKVTVIACAALGSAWVAGCNPTPPTSIPPGTTVDVPDAGSADANQYENEPQAAVIPGGEDMTNCPVGRVFLSHGPGAQRWQSAGIPCVNGGGVGSPNCFSSDPPNELQFRANGVSPDDVSLLQDAGVVATTPIADAPTTLCMSAPVPSTHTPRDLPSYTNSNIARVNLSQVLNVHLITRSHTPMHPQPPVQADYTKTTCTNPFVTSALAMTKSNTCGTSWYKSFVYDPADASAGQFGQVWDPVTQGPVNAAVSEYPVGGSSTTQAALTQSGLTLDRPELFIDDSDPNAPPGKTPAYVTITSRFGSTNGFQFILASPDGGDTWNAPVLAPGRFRLGPGNPAFAGEGIDEPVMMASNNVTVGSPTTGIRTTEHRLFLFKCELAPDNVTVVPTLWWSDDYFHTVSSGLDVSYQLPVADGAAPNPLRCGYASAFMPDGAFISNSGHGIAPQQEQGVLVTYPGVVASPGGIPVQVQAIVSVTFPASLSVVNVINSKLVDESADSPPRHIIQASLVHVDQQNVWTSTTWSDAALLYWHSYDAVDPSSPTGVTEEYAVVHNGLVWTDVLPLSEVGGFPQSWNFAALGPGLGISDYWGDDQRGAFFYGSLTANGPSTPNFFVPWMQSKPAPAVNSQIHANFVTLN